MDEPHEHAKGKRTKNRNKCHLESIPVVLRASRDCVVTQKVKGPVDDLKEEVLIATISLLGVLEQDLETLCGEKGVEVGHCYVLYLYL
jgi:hypothetical protein